MNERLPHLRLNCNAVQMFFVRGIKLYLPLQSQTEAVPQLTELEVF